ncbi:hypothetical protein N1031_17925 [Herbiconiux moechotypicola]|uniref:GNAT family N-acetyltransferase n=1 Tax=Herbiconiux moechotypicola TaxID=637393 RepID=A0ABP5R460_9MICO|nr:hypothetical protein [Herbiconiux moechotypicola]MCS5731639.1 hypothetical protein [Herbiconiux moechotypicola]
MAWLPEGFVHPERAEIAVGTRAGAVPLYLHLRPIRADDVELDLIAVSGSRERLFEVYGASWGWPPAVLSEADDRADLEYHEDEMRAGSSFNYALFDEAETALLGCVYIDPADEGEAHEIDAVVSWWVVDELLGSEAEAAVDEFVPRWLASVWPLPRIRFGVSGPAQ